MAKLFDGALLVSDIDGTLLKGNIMPPDNLIMINRFCADGGTFAFSTGRAVSALAPLKQFFSVLPLSVVYNGAMLYDYSREIVLYEKTLSDNDKSFILSVKENFPLCGIEVYSHNECFLLRETAAVKRHLAFLEISASKSDDLAAVPVNKVNFFLENDIDRVALMTFADRVYGESGHLENTASYLPDGKIQICELYPMGVTKGTGLEQLKRVFSVAENNTYAIGDYNNDLPMLLAADMSAAPSDAPESVRKYVGYVAAACQYGAVGDFIRHLYKLKSERM